MLTVHFLINKNIGEPDQIFKKHAGFGKGRP